jgi:hypothetical protein
MLLCNTVGLHHIVLIEFITVHCAFRSEANYYIKHEHVKI